MDQLAMNCTCKEWVEGIPQMAAQAVFCSIQSAGPEYTAAKFKFCPWCGKILDPVQGLTELLDNMLASRENWEALVTILEAIQNVQR